MELAEICLWDLRIHKWLKSSKNNVVGTNEGALHVHDEL